MDNDPTNSDDVIDSRDIERRIDELDAERGALVDELADNPTGEAKHALIEWDASDEADELKALKAFRDELEPYCEDWHHGVTIIADSYFAEYAEELANDIGAINKDAGWPLSFIDWDAAAEALKADYTSGEFDGVTYWAR